MAVLAKSTETVLNRLGLRKAHCALILGSGWSSVADTFEVVSEIPYSEVPGLGEPGVTGHTGALRHARCQNQDILIFQGRRHWYEGDGWTPVALPVYMAAQARAETVLLTNAAGGIRETLSPGDLMVIEDHINAIGANPLMGNHNPFWGQRFPDQTQVYNRALLKLLNESASQVGATTHKGVYLATSGPTYETPAEIRAYRALGADAVGMSTVPEAILANAAGLSVAGISCITNLAAGVAAEPLGHDEVLETTQRAMPVMTKLINQFVTHVCS